jgi:hypothetical protein
MAQEDLENADTEAEWREAKALVKAFRTLINFESDLLVEVETTRQESKQDAHRY